MKKTTFSQIPVGTKFFRDNGLGGPKPTPHLKISPFKAPQVFSSYNASYENSLGTDITYCSIEEGATIHIEEN
jgi:hypothetical protein